MKKLAIASAVAALVAAGSSNAATIYDNKGLKFKIDGDFQIHLQKDIGNNQDLNLEFDDLEIKNKVSYDLGNGMKAFGQVHFGFKDAANNKNGDSYAELEEAFLGMQTGNFKFSFGKTNSAADEFGLGTYWESPLAEDAFDGKTATDGDDLLRLDVELESVTIVLSHEIEADSEASGDPEFTGLFIGGAFGGLELGAAVQSYSAAPGAADIDSWGIQASYDFGKFTLQADYSEVDGGAVDYEHWNLAGSAMVTENVELGLGFQGEEDAGVDDDGWYANATYRFPTQKNVYLFGELSDTDSGDDMGYLAGMRVKF